MLKHRLAFQPRFHRQSKAARGGILRQREPMRSSEVLPPRIDATTSVPLV